MTLSSRSLSQERVVIAIGPSYSPAAPAPQPGQQPIPARSQNVRRCYLHLLRLLRSGSGRAIAQTCPVLHCGARMPPAAVQLQRVIRNLLPTSSWTLPVYV